MGRRQAFALALLGVLCAAAVVLAIRIERHFQRGGRLVAEFGRAHLVRLAPETEACLERLEEPVFVTYFASPESGVPSEMRAVERGVTDLLEALHARASERFDFQIVDPTTLPELAGFAARRRVAPFRLRSVSHDAYSEVTVWSSLSIALGSRPEVLLSGIGPENLPRLQATLVAWLEQLREPRRARIALRAPAGFQELSDALAERGDVRPFDPSRLEELDRVDLLVWMQPEVPSDACLAALDRFLERGGSLWVAFQRMVLGARSLVEVDGEPALTVGLDERATPLLQHFGLRPVPGLLLDEDSEPAFFQDEEVRAPFLVRCIAPNQDFHLFRAQPNGTLLFAAPTPLSLDDGRLRALRWDASVLATTSDASWIEQEPVPPLAPRPLASLTRSESTAVSKQALMVALTAGDSWRGRAIFAGSTAPFEDGLLHREHAAHPRLLSTLLDECLSDERLVVAGASHEEPQPLPRLGPRARLVARVGCVFAFPLALALSAALATGSFAGVRRAARPRGTPVALAGALAVLVALALVATARTLHLGLDATSGGKNRLAPETRAIAARAGELGKVEVDLVFSERAALPPAQRAALPRIEALLAALERAGAELDVQRIVPSDLGPAELAWLAERGVQAHESAVSDGDTTTVRRFHASILLHRGSRGGTSGGTRDDPIELGDERALETLEYRLALALWILNGGERPHVAFASDVPRLSAAEAHEEYQQQGLFAPKGSDVYALAREILRGAGIRVSHVDPRDPRLPPDVDALVWLQPRRSIEKMIDVFVRHLVGGGKALLAAQHFNVESLQHRGTNFELVYWPQPQSPDVEFLYFPELSIELVREVVFDELSTPITTETKIRGRRAGKDFERQASALPFLIRASAANFDPGSPVTATLGDQAFPWANYLRFDPARLAELGIRAHTLITTSERSWTYSWKSGWIPEEVLAGPPQGAGGEHAFQGHLPLAVLFEGTFPAPTKPLVMPFSAGAAEAAPAEEEPAGAQAEPAGEEHSVVASATPEGPAPGKLLYLAGSELFKNHRILDPEFRGDQLLWNATLSLALEPELARIATRRVTAPGFGYVAPERRLLLRIAVLAAGPLALGALGLALVLRRRTDPRGTTGGRP